MIRVFVSHASEDKDSFVRDLAKKLRDQKFEVWYDEFTLKIGAPLRASIDRGLSECHFGIVVLSEAFFSNKWTKDELEGLFSRESANEHNMILPIWHGVGFKEVASHSPMLAGRVAADTRHGVDAVTSQIASTIRDKMNEIGAQSFTLEGLSGGKLSMWAQPNAPSELCAFDSESLGMILEMARESASKLIKDTKNKQQGGDGDAEEAV